LVAIGVDSNLGMVEFVSIYSQEFRIIANVDEISPWGFKQIVLNASMNPSHCQSFPKRAVYYQGLQLVAPLFPLRPTATHQRWAHRSAL
jgi:hypothetical protein